MWWEKLLDKGTGVFEKWVDFESVKQEADAARNYRLISEANAAEGGNSMLSGMTPFFLVGAALLVVVFLRK